MKLLALLGLLASCSQLVNAHSAAAKPLRGLSHPSSISFDILPRGPHTKRGSSAELQHSDSLRISLRAFTQTFHLHLRPNNDLLHPSATIKFVENDEQFSRIVPIQRESVRAYMGEVVPSFRSDERLREDSAGVVGRVSSWGISSDQTHPTDLGWARIVVHDATARLFEGAFSVNGVIHHVTTRENYLRHRTEQDVDVEEDGDLVVWRESDAVPQAPVASTCGHDGLSYNTDPAENPALRNYPKEHSLVGSEYDEFGLPDFGFISKRQDIGGESPTGSNFINSIGDNSGCPKTQRVLFMGVAADCEYTTRYGSPENATTQILTNWNIVSALYRSSFNVSMGIIELQVHAAACPATADPATPWNIACTDSITLNDRLSLFSRWRGSRTDDAGLWHLLSGCPTGTEVGIAWLSTLCQQSSVGQQGSFVSGTGVSTAGRTESMVIAHEVGHNFGAIHDCDSSCSGTSASCCPASAGTCSSSVQSIMAPSSNGDQGTSQTFSPCSIGNVCSLMSTATGSASNTTCLLDANDTKNRQTISLQMCGNGIVESGEDCDPGVNSNSSCCDPQTCKFRAGALCDPENSACCTPQCGFQAANTTCRASKDTSCDTAETCTGSSADCPADVFAPNGQSCGSGSLACASGQCTSVSKQCQSVGASLGLSEACPQQSSSCQVSCRDPTQSNSCILLQSLLVDGSPCGTGGTCTNGNCGAGNAGNAIKSWFKQNPSVAIPVAVICGLVALSILWCILIRLKHCCFGRQVRKKQQTRMGPMVPINNPQQGWNYAPQPAPNNGYVPVPLGLGQGHQYEQFQPPQQHQRANSPPQQQQRANSVYSNVGPAPPPQHPTMIASPTSPTRGASLAYPPSPQRYSDAANYGNGQGQQGHERSLSGYGNGAPGDRTSDVPLIQDPSRRGTRLTRGSRN